MSPTGEGPPTVPPDGESWPGWPTVVPPLRPLGSGDPTIIGSYRLEALLGDGGMGRVYVGRTRAGRAVAIKVVHRQYAGDPSFRKRFEREVATAKQVHGLYTAPVVDADVEADEPWLATAYVPGPSLQYVVTYHGSIRVDAALRLIAGVAEALQSIHAAGVTHRDLKPSNVILTADGPTVIDFGIARAVDVTSITGTGAQLGTPAYMAPEQIRGYTLTPATDIFALGVLATFTATGRPAFGGGEGVTYRILEQAPDMDTCPEPVRSIAKACLDKDHQRRPTPLEVVELCQDPPTGVSNGTHQAPPPPAAIAAPEPNESDGVPIRLEPVESTHTPPPLEGGEKPATQDSDAASPPDARPPTIGAKRLLTPSAVRAEPIAPPPDLKRRRRTRIRLVVLAIVMLVLTATGITTWSVVNDQYFVGETEDGEIAIFQGVRGSIFGIELNTQVQGSCDPEDSTCNKFYVNDLRELGRNAVRSGTEILDNITDARQFILDLRTKFPLPPCDALEHAQAGSSAPTAGTPTTKPPSGTNRPATTSSTPLSEPPPEPDPGVNCRQPREGGG